MSSPSSAAPSLNLLAGILVATIVSTGCGEDGAGKPNRVVEGQLQEVLNASVSQSDVLLPGAIASYRSSHFRSWSGAAGLGDVPGGVSMRPSDRFRAGSVLKTLLATVTLQHVEKSVLSLDQRLPALLPESVTARIAHAEEISLRMLLNHTSGIPEWVTDEVVFRVTKAPLHVWTEDEELEIVSHLPPVFAPGTSWSYSNTNYTLVGLVLDRVAGKSWRAQIRERVLQPLDMRETSLPEPGASVVDGTYAHGYQDLDGALIDLSAVDSSMAGAAGGHALVTTTRDLGRFVDALMDGQLFTRTTTLPMMLSMVDAPDPSGLPHRYGLGIEEYTLPNGTVAVGHGGSTAGYATMMFRLPSAEASIVTAVNTADLLVNALQVFIPAVEAIAKGPREP